MTKFAKVAVSVPATTFEAVKRTGRKLGKTRSSVVTLALEEWLRGLRAGEAARRYVEGYLRQPETMDEIEATDGIAARAAGERGHGNPASRRVLRSDDRRCREPGARESRETRRDLVGAARAAGSTQARRPPVP